MGLVRKTCQSQARPSLANMSLRQGAASHPNAFSILDQPNMVGTRILLASYYCPTSAHAGGLRILDMYRLIRARFPSAHLDLYTCRHPGIDGAYKDAEDIFDNIYYSTTTDIAPSGLVSNYHTCPHYDVIDLQFHQTARHIEAYRSLGTKVLFTPMESLVHAFLIEIKNVIQWKKRLSFKRIAGAMKQAVEEIVVCHKADEVICVSPSDAAILRTISRSKNITSIETGISSTEFPEAFANIATPSLEAKDNIIIFVAYFGSETNIAALHWYIDKVHPRIKTKVTNYTLWVVGRGDLSTFRGSDESIEIIGEVPFLGSSICQAKVGIAPALSGSGFRGQVNQYAIFGVPSVISPIAAMGLAYENGVDAFVAESPENFADRCISLLLDSDLNMAMGRKARQTALSHYSWESRLGAIKQAYRLEELP